MIAPTHLSPGVAADLLAFSRALNRSRRYAKWERGFRTFSEETANLCLREAVRNAGEATHILARLTWARQP